MSSSISQQCAICSNQPQDMLILSCFHNLCLDCATELFAASLNRQFLQCQICLEPTQLDQQTINCLSYLGKRDKKPKEQLYPYVPKPTKQRDFNCIQHNQKSIYFCFDCQSGSICSQCVLSSRHEGHNVKTIKKASMLLKQKIQQNSSSLGELSLKIKQNQQYLNVLKGKMQSQYEQKQKSLKILFQNAIQLIQKRYSELKGQLQGLSKRSIEILEGTINVLNEKKDFFDNTIHQNNKVIEKQNQQSIIARFIQIQLKRPLFILDIPNISMSQFFQKIVLIGQNTISKDLDILFDKIKWSRRQNTILKQNKEQVSNFIRIDQSLIKQNSLEYQHNRVFRQQFQGNSKQISQNSVSKYSGIKGASRRLQMNRSMDNATNIINKLQERIKR